MVASNSDSNNINSVFWIDSLSDENKRLEMQITKKTASLIAQPSLVVGTADWNEAIRKFAQSFLYKKTTNSYYRLMTTYLGNPMGIDIRISNHPAGDDDNWHLTEGNGLANYRLSIYFRGDTSASTKECSDGVTLYEQGFHYKHLKNTVVITAIRNSIVGFMKSGVYQEIKQPQIESDDVVAERLRQKDIERNKRNRQRYFDNGTEDDIKESNTMKYMKTNRRTITESQLRNIIAESVKKVLNEHDYFDTNPNNGKFPKDLEAAISDAYCAASDLLDLAHRYMQTLDDDYARTRCKCINDAADKFCIVLDNFRPGMRTC